MKVLLNDCGCKIPNLALMKISSYHKDLGDEVFLNECEKPNKVYISSLYSWEKAKVETLLKKYPEAQVGGTGWDLKKELPAEIEMAKPDYDLYSIKNVYERMRGISSKESKLSKAETIVKAGLGFTSRGCIRNCKFCVVPKKEGKFRQESEIKDLLNPRSNTLILLDNNLTADPYIIPKLQEIRDRNLTVDITQGIDIRLITPEIARALSEVKHLRSIHYAWDLMENEREILKNIRILSRYIKTYRHMCFVLIGFNTTFEEDMYRYRKLSEIGIKPYIMPYNNIYPSVQHHHFARWINSRYHTICTFNEYKPWVKENEVLKKALA